MTENFVILPDDGSNTGKLVRTNQRTVNGSSVEEHFTILQDYTSNNQAKIDSDGKINIAGSISSIPGVSINSPSTIGSYTYQNVAISGTPSVNIGNSGSIYVSNQISEITVGSESWIQNFNVLGSSRIITNKVAGSIVNMPSVDINNPATIGSYSIQNISGSVAISTSVLPVSGVVTANTGLYAGSKFYQGDIFGISGNVITTINNPAAIGSYTTQQVLGSVVITSPISALTGSESYIKGGSIEIFTGSIHVTNFSAGTGYAGSDVWQGTNPWIILGSVHQINSTPATLTGSIEVFTNTGSVEVYGSLSAIAGSEQWIKNWGELGSSVVVANLYAGSKIYAGDTLPISGTVNATVGSVSIYNLGSTSWVYINSGTQYVDVAAGSIYVTNFSAGTGYAGSDAYVRAGSISLLNSLGSSFVFGSVAITSPINVETGSQVYVQNVVEVSGTKLDNLAGSFSVNNFNVIGSSRIISNFGTLGSSRVITNFGDLGSSRVITAGSVEVYDTKPLQVEQSRGAFGFSGAIFITSGTQNILTSPGAGSKLFLKGFNASAETASQFRVFFSGGNLLNTFVLPSSGTVAMNMMGMEPSGGTNQPLAIGMYNNGSLYFTAMTEDSL